MKLIYQIILGVLLATGSISAYAGGIMMMGGGVAATGGSCSDSSCTGFLLCQNFEGTGYDNSETWNEDAGTPDEDYATTALRGTQSLQLTSGEVTYATFTENAEVWVHFLFRTDALNDNDYFAHVSGADRILSSAGAIRISNGTDGASSAEGVIAANTTYHIWVHVTATAKSYYVSTSATRPETAAVTLTATIPAVSAIRLQTTTANRIYDQVIVSTTDITPVCD